MASRGERFRAGGTPSSPAVVALVALSFLARLCSALQGTEMDLSIDWLSECGCTGIEIESVSLTASLWHKGFRDLRLNRCSEDNPRCPGQLPSAEKALEGLLSDHKGGSSREPDVVVVHVAFLGVCGVPQEYAQYSRCTLRAMHRREGGLFSWLGWWGRSSSQVEGSIVQDPLGGRHRPHETCNRPYLIARAMGEEDAIGSMAVRQCNTRYDEVWVPSAFHLKAFTDSGVKAEKVHVIPEIVNTEEFDPSAVKAEPLEFGDSSPVETRFLSVFKWEPRKNWVQLLLAFAHSFLLEPRAGLYIKTSRYMGADPKGDANRFLSSLLKQIKNKPRDFLDTQEHLASKDRQKVKEALGDTWVFDEADPRCLLQRVKVVDSRLPSKQMPEVFKGADAFVLPSHGEGWGLPFMEAMAMELPTIGTKFGGNVDFMHPSCSLLLDVDKRSRGPGGGKWAMPNNDQLISYMLWVFNNPDAAQELGRRARKHILENWSAERVAADIQKRLAAADRALRAPKKQNKWQ